MLLKICFPITFNPCFDSRMELLKDLRKTYAEELEKEQETLEYLKNRGDAFVMLR